jgi:predicted Co/Zn/Cd cation transporter (cation efflux family)
MGMAPALAAMTVAAMIARLGIFMAVMCHQFCLISDGVKYLVDLVLNIIFGRLQRHHFSCFQCQFQSL